MAGLVRRRNIDTRIPTPQGTDATSAQEVYQGFYGELQPPATMYATSPSPLFSTDIVPSLPNSASNCSVVSARFGRAGLRYMGGWEPRQQPIPGAASTTAAISSEFQPTLMGMQPNAVFNDKWYIAYPAATVMNGGRHNLGLSERVPQLNTRSTGGPGPAAMRPYPRFNRVQRTPRYTTTPRSYNTQAGNA